MSASAATAERGEWTTGSYGQGFMIPVPEDKQEAYRKMAEDTMSHATLIGELVSHLAATMENNQLDLFGAGEYRKPFIDLLNTRSNEYAGFDFPGAEPDYACLRSFATRFAEVMAEGDDSKLVKAVVADVVAAVKAAG